MITDSLKANNRTLASENEQKLIIKDFQINFFFQTKVKILIEL